MENGLWRGLGLTRRFALSEGGTGAGPKSGFEIMVLTNLRSERGMSLIVGSRPPSEDHRSTHTFSAIWRARGTGMFSATLHGPPFRKMMTVRVSICTVEVRVNTGTRDRADDACRK